MKDARPATPLDAAFADLSGHRPAPSRAERRAHLKALETAMRDAAEEIAQAIDADFGGRPRPETLLTEVAMVIGGARHAARGLRRWMRPDRVTLPAHLWPSTARVERVPLGLVGIIGPWNFPLNLVVLPASAAFAAGNRVMIKMSEVTPRTATLMAALAPAYFDTTELHVVTGDVDTAAAFAALPFDHLFFTGSPAVGALVQRAASANLVPVTLELGGKNPVVVAPDADLARSASRIASARMINGGQVCVCPDYVFVPSHRVDEFVGIVRDTLHAMFPSIVANQDYCSAVNEANFERVVGLVEDARAKGARVDAVAPPGEVLPDPVARKIAPTIVRGVDDSMRLADEETFGPVLTVHTYDRLDDVVDYVNARPAPLVAYWFGPDGPDFRSFVERTRSGGVARNDFAAQMIPSAAPFGGVGRSGMGAYHGKAGFDAFSHHRTVVGSDLPFTITGRAAPPFGVSTRVTTALTLRMARNRTRRRLRKT